LAILVCDFSWGLLFFWGIQLHHLTPDSILHIAIFVHLCEAFFGIYPHFDLFKSLFFLNTHPNFRNDATIGGANAELCLEMVGRYIPYTPRCQIGDWKAEWFISTIMRRRFPTEFLVHPSGVMNGLTTSISRFRKRNCCRGLLF